MSKEKKDLYEQQIRRYRQMLETNPDEAQRIYGVSLLNSLDPAERTVAMQAMGASVNEAEDCYNLGVHAARQDNWSQAIDYFRQAIESNPDLTDAIYNLAVCYERLGHAPQAKDTWRVYLEIIPEGPEAERLEKHIKTL